VKTFHWISKIKDLFSRFCHDIGDLPQGEKSVIRLEPDKIFEVRKKKIDRLISILENDYFERNEHGMLNFLSAEKREKFSVFETENISAHGYDSHARKIIGDFKDGLILDCGCGLRSSYLENVVNYEIVPYLTTDVLGVAEELPFKDEAFDAVFSLNVLEHVKDPFKSAKEISRVLKRGGILYCVVPFLQPVHGYPSHYYNMTAAGLKNLFEEKLKIKKQFVYKSGLPIHGLKWLLESWAEGLDGKAKESFLNMPVKEFLKDPYSQLNNEYVTELSDQKNFELACTTSLIAVKEDKI
jgi:SAM-dependent methyltransferase